MRIFTIGFAGKTAEEFFAALRGAKIRRLLDLRLRNVSQLTGFTKKDDLPFLLREICGAEYIHEPLLAPTDELLDGHRKKKLGWSAYETEFMRLMKARKVEERFPPEFFELPTVLLCSEPSADHCHRRLVIEYLNSKWTGSAIEPVHL